MRIVLLGLPGGGKSASGNTILGSMQFTSCCGFGLVTRETVSGSAEVEGRQVVVVDTPGLTAKVLTPRKLYDEIVKSIAEPSPGPHVFVIVVRIGRVSEADILLFNMVPKLFGCDASKYAMVVFTYGDELRGQSIDKMIQDHTDVSELVSLCGGRYCVFNNRLRGNRQQVRTFLETVDEMVKVSRDPYTSERLYKVQPISVKMSITLESFLKMLNQLDCCSGNNEVD